MNVVDIFITTIIGIIGIIFGLAIKKYQLTNIIAGFNPNKHDPIKVSNITGENIVLGGVLIILFGVIRISYPDKENLVNMIETSSILLLIINLIYRINKYGSKGK